MKIQNTIALVTGANRGIGKALVQALLAKGASKVYAAARDLNSLSETIALDPKRVQPIVLDITRPDQIAAAVKATQDVRVLINNAGVLAGGDILSADISDIERDIATNAFGTLAVIRAFAPILEKNTASAIVNILSVVGLAPMSGIAGYSASKATLNSFTQALRPVLKPKGVDVIGVFPGPVDTDMSKEITFPKTSALAVAEDILSGIEAGQEDIYPDPMAKDVGKAWAADPKAVERQFAAF
jgi:short-subunit dehydrogenase